MEQKGTVISVNGKLATVEFLRESACSGCHNKSACETGVMMGCGKTQKVTVVANNLCNAEIGDNVIITSDSLKTLIIAFCVFVLPLIITFIGYAVAKSLFADSAATPIIAAAIFFISFFGLFFGINEFLKNKISVNITTVTNK